jgi:tetratricopeptide (TPR) repeat protein
MPFPSIHSHHDARRGRFGGAATLFALVIAAGPAGGAPPPKGEAERQARDHYRKGDEAYGAGRYQDAYREFAEGYQLAPRPVFLLNMGHSERRLGHLADARALYQKFLLVEPQSPYAPEVQQVIGEIDSYLAIEAASRSPTDPSPAGAPSIGAAPAEVPPYPVAMSSAASPAVTAPPLPPQPPLYRRWWVWASVAGVLAAGVTTTVLLGRPSYQKAGSLATLGP